MKIIHLKEIIRKSALAILFSTIINTILFFIASSLGVFVHSHLQEETPEISIIAVISSTILFSSIGVSLFIVLLKSTKQPVKIFTWSCWLILIFLLPVPFVALHNPSLEIGVILNLMHLAPAYLLWKFLTNSKLYLTT